MSVIKSISGLIRNRFISGLLVTVPLVITYQVLRFLFVKLDSLLNPIVSHYTGYAVPGLGIAITILLVLLVGLIAHSVIGGRMIKFWEDLLVRLPVIRTVYTPTKQLLETFAVPAASSYSRVALVEYPRKGIWVIGFLAQDVDLSNGGIKDDYVAVYLPSTPTPFTGWLAMIPRADIRPIDLPVEEAIKFVVSGGVSCPESLMGKPTQKQEALGKG